MNVPTGFCSDEVYQAVQDYSDERDRWNEAAGLEEWLEADLAEGLAPIVSDQLTDTAGEVDEQANAAAAAIEAEIMRIFEEDQAAAAQFSDLEDAREQLLAQVAGAEPEDSMLDATIPDGLKDLLGDEADELSNRIDALEQQLATLAALQQVEGAEPYTECEVYEEVLTELTADLEQEADALLATLGDSNND